MPESILVYALTSRAKAKKEKLLKALSSREMDDGRAEEFSPVSEKSEDQVGTSMSLAMQLFKRKKADKVPFIIDMVSMVMVIIVVVTSSTIIIVGVPALMPGIPDKRNYE